MSLIQERLSHVSLSLKQFSMEPQANTLIIPLVEHYFRRQNYRGLCDILGRDVLIENTLV